MSKEFAERRSGSFYLIGSRVPFAHVVRQVQNGEPPEAIRLHFSTLSLEQVYGAITFYLGNKDDVEKDIIERGREEDEFENTQPFPVRGVRSRQYVARVSHTFSSRGA